MAPVCAAAPRPVRVQVCVRRRGPGVMPLLLELLRLSVVGTASAGSSPATISVAWDAPPLAVSPAINSWHDTPLGASGNPHHDGPASPYPPSEWDIVDALNAGRAALASPHVRLWSDTQYIYDWPNSSRTTVVGPAALPPNTSTTCETLFPSCACCPRAECNCCSGTQTNSPVSSRCADRISPSTSWDFAALDVQVKSLQGSTVFPDTNILQITGNTPPWWFFASSGKGFADPSGVTVGHYFSRVLDWYQKGGFVDELGQRHYSGHNYSFGYLEVLNEVNLHADVYIGPTPLDSIRNYIRFYDGVAKIVKANHPSIKLIGNCMAGSGSTLVWSTFLNRSEHAVGTPWPIDAVSYHVYSGSAPPSEWNKWADALRPSALANVRGAAESADVIKHLSPSTKIFMDEVGVLLGCKPPFDMTATLGDGVLSDWWNTQAVIWALFVGELSAAGVDMIGASQYVGWPTSSTYSIGHLGLPAGGNLSSGTPFQPQIGAGGNCPEMSMVSWRDGSLNARSWAMKMIIEGLGHSDKRVLATNVSFTIPPPPLRKGCHQLTWVVDADMAGGDICEFNMSNAGTRNQSGHDKGSDICAAACCAHERCDHFVSLSAKVPSFSGGGTCKGRSPCLPVPGAFCCYLKTAATHQMPSPYPKGAAVAGTTTPAVQPTFEPIYARAFAPASTNHPWPGPGNRAILLANFDGNHSHAVTFEGLRGAEIWSVVRGGAGRWQHPYSKVASRDDQLNVPPLAVVLAFFNASRIGSLGTTQ